MDCEAGLAPSHSPAAHLSEYKTMFLSCFIASKRHTLRDVSFTFIQFFHVEGLISTSIGKISSLPMSMVSVSSSFTG